MPKRTVGALKSRLSSSQINHNAWLLRLHAREQLIINAVDVAIDSLRSGFTLEAAAVIFYPIGWWEDDPKVVAFRIKSLKHEEEYLVWQEKYYKFQEVDRRKAETLVDYAGRDTDAGYLAWEKENKNK